ncbi:hypothetical protein BX600DRAFT_438922 [Xylariales sp. PMI_506]|nr:hypothetical protein BX600DRAFT_438922 [Xylariales sp. PMI_506]
MTTTVSLPALDEVHFMRTMAKESISATDFSEAISSHNYNRTQYILEIFFDRVAVGDYAWLQELQRIGYSSLETTDELLEKQVHGSWIFDQFKVPSTQPFTPTFHQSLCGRHSSHSFDVDNDVVLITGSKHTDINHVELSPNETVEYLCGLCGAKPAMDGSCEIELGVAMFDADNTKATVTLQEEDNSAMLEYCSEWLGAAIRSHSPEQIEMRRIPFSAISELRQQLQDCSSSVISEDLLETMAVCMPLADDPARVYEATPQSRAHLSSLVAQFLALALLSHVQAHCGPIRPFFLDTPLSTVILTGNISPDRLSGTSKNAAVLGSLSRRHHGGPSQSMASPYNPNVLYGLSFGGGVISGVAGRSAQTRRELHFSKTLVPSSGNPVAFGRRTKIRVGATVTENKDCRAEPLAQLKQVSFLLEEMNTFPSYWERTERQLGLGVQDLESLYAVQVSICTGVARRVRLRDLLAEVLPVYVNGLITKPPLWNSLNIAFRIIQTLISGDLGQWVQKLDHNHQLAFEGLIVAVLHLMRDSGIDRKGQNFVIACIQPNMPFRCFKVPCRRESYWAKMLSDSEETATFAIAATLAASSPRSSRGRSPADGWTLKDSEAYLMGPPGAALLAQVRRADAKAEAQLLVSPSAIPSPYLYRLFRRGRPVKPRRLREKKLPDEDAEDVVVLVCQDPGLLA